VVEALRDAIVAGELEDGERLIEDKIARELKTSRGPVREALKQLEHEGFVVSYPYRGAVVLGVSDEEVREVLVPVRLVLERFSFPKAAAGMSDDDFAEIAKEVWQMAEAARTQDLARSVEADMRSGTRSRRGSARTSSATDAPRGSSRSPSSTASC
jgi:DNA-binding GntR family transcriptional regulator